MSEDTGYRIRSLKQAFFDENIITRRQWLYGLLACFEAGEITEDALDAYLEIQ